MGIRLHANRDEDAMKETPFDPTNREVLDRLRTVPAFDSLPEGQLRMALQAASLRRYEIGETVISEGDFDNRVFFLIFGHLSVTVQNNEVGTLRRLGDVFGEMGIIDGSPRSASIVAVKPTLCVTLDDTAMGELGSPSKIFTQAVMYRVFAEVMAVRLRDANSRIAELEAELQRLNK